jgi:hypothetical protein
LRSFTLTPAGLLIGEIAATPLGGHLAKRIPPRVLLMLVGVSLVATIGYRIWKALG